MDNNIVTGTARLCDHRIGSKNTTIMLAKDDICMVYPPTIWGICHICGKTFKYQRGDDGRFTRVSDST